MLMSRKQVVPIDTGRTTETACLEDVLQDDLDGLYRFALRLTRNTDDAQELTQEAAVRALQRQGKIVRNWRAWLFQTVYHVFVSSWRRRSRWKEAGETDCDRAQLENSGAPLPTVVATEDVRRAIEELPEELRAVVWLSDAEDFRQREIAEILDWPIGTVASRLWRAREELRTVLSAYGPRGEKQS
jgi:RNA polymerase sigma-70 factor (ECF subfamily)